MCISITPILLLAFIAIVTPPSADTFPQGCGMSCFPSCCAQKPRHEATTELTLARATIYPPGNDCDNHDLDATKAAEPGEMDTDAAMDMMRSPFAAINAAGRRSMHKKKKNEGMGKENAKESSGDEGKADDAGEIMRSPFAAINAAGRQKHKKKKSDEDQE